MRKPAVDNSTRHADAIGRPALVTLTGQLGETPQQQKEPHLHIPSVELVLKCPQAGVPVRFEGEQAEKVRQCMKGDWLAISGELRVFNWETQGGSKRSKLVVFCRQMRVVRAPNPVEDVP